MDGEDSMLEQDVDDGCSSEGSSEVEQPVGEEEPKSKVRWTNNLEMVKNRRWCRNRRC